MDSFQRNFIEKINYQIKTSGVTATKLANYFGVSKTAISNWTKTGRIGKDRLEGLASFFGTSIDYWIRECPPESEKPQVNITPNAKAGEFSEAGKIKIWNEKEDLGDEVEWIDLWEFSFSAGNGKVNWDIKAERELPFNKPLFKELGMKPSNAKLVKVDGRSMEPFFFSGDKILIDTSRTNIINGRIYALCYDGEALIKQVFKTNDGLKLKSFNPEYPEREIVISELADDNTLQIMGMVVFRFGSILSSF